MPGDSCLLTPASGCKARPCSSSPARQWKVCGPGVMAFGPGSSPCREEGKCQGQDYVCQLKSWILYGLHSGHRTCATKTRGQGQAKKGPDRWTSLQTSPSCLFPPQEAGLEFQRPAKCPEGKLPLRRQPCDSTGQAARTNFIKFRSFPPPCPPAMGQQCRLTKGRCEM